MSQIVNSEMPKYSRHILMDILLTATPFVGILIVSFVIIAVLSYKKIAIFNYTPSSDVFWFPVRAEVGVSNLDDLKPLTAEVTTFKSDLQKSQNLLNSEKFTGVSIRNFNPKS